MNSAAPKIKTVFESVFEQWLELPETVVGEIIAGELNVSPRPAPKHARASSAIGIEIGGPFNFGKNGGPGGWWILDEPELHLVENILVPDIAGWKKERMPLIPEEAFFSIAPDWICEILSPGTVALDRVKKMPLYLEVGVKYLWLVDPIDKTLEVYQSQQKNWVLLKTYMNNDKIRAIPFDAIEVDLSLLWS